MKKRLTFGVITAECYREHTAEMMSGILAQCTLADCNVIVLSAKNNFQEPVTPHNDHEAELFQLAQAPEFDGFLYLREARDDRSVPSRKDCCEVLWCDRAGKSSGISDRAVKQSDIIADLTQEAQHPTAYYLSPLHMNEQQFGLIALSFGKLPCCYQAEYCTFLNCLCLALEHLTLPGKRDTDREKSIENPQLFEALVPLREEMQQHPEKDWSIQGLCQHTHISRSYLQRMYKTYFGKSIFEELIDFRMQKAKALLRDTELSISEVAAACGYGSYSHFANQFKAQEGITPSGYREKCSAT